MTSLMRPTSGQVTIDGFDSVRDSAQTRQLIGYLPENNPLYGDLRVREFLRFVARAKRAELSQVERVCQDCGLTEVASRPIAKLSKGYRQRVGLAQALIGAPKLLILDEPTVGLDPCQIHEIRSLIKSQAGQRTVIVSSHILPEINQLCDRVVIINKGEVVADAATAELRQAGSTRLRLKLAGQAEAARQSLLALNGLTNVTVLSPSELEVEAPAEPDQRSAVAAALTGFGLLELSVHESSLEEVFMQLVSEEDQLA